MTDPAMWSRAKQVATYIVRDWMLLDATERTMDKLVEEIELELDRSFEAGMRAASHAAPLIRTDTLERAAKVAEAHLMHDGHPSGGTAITPGIGAQIAAAIRALKEQP
jgi:hypothetical protein